MFRREWRQQLLVLALLTVAVTAAVVSITIVHHIGPADNSELGEASALLEFDASEPGELAAGIDAARKHFGTIDVIARRSVAVPGSVDTVDYRAQDPNGPYGGVLLALRAGRYPVRPEEVAVTAGVAESLRVELGSTLALDGRRRTVVGMVENPRELSDEFALVAPSALDPTHVTVMVDASENVVMAFFGHGTGPPALSGARDGGDDNPHAPTLAMFSVSTVFVLLASLVAAAGFAVVAQRRLRQLGMLAAVGATEKQLRLVLLANGAIVGVIAAVVGTAAGLAGWLVFAPTLESAMNHRVDRLDLPWWVIAATAALATLGATAAAWWPGRAAARLPVVLALSGRPPRPRPARHSAIAAGALIAVGAASLALSNRDRAALIIVGIVATILGGLLVGPLAIRIFSRVAGQLPVARRLALRDLARYQARSGAALAAVTLALGIAATVVVVASAEAAKKSAEPPVLSNRQIRVYVGPPQARELIPVDVPPRLSALTASVRQIAAELDRATVVPLQKIRRPSERPGIAGDAQVYYPVDLTRRSDRMYTPDGPTFVATPAVLRYLGVDAATIDPGTDFLVDRGVGAEGLVIPGLTKRSELAVTNVQHIEVGGHHFGTDSGPKPSFMTLDALRRHGWKQIPAGWLVESSRPLTSDQVAAAREAAAKAGLTIEVEDGGNSNGALMGIAIAAGAFLALAILALTVGLIRSESAGDLRTLTATGATARIRRTLTATTAGALALLGALLGVAGAYVMMVALYHDDLSYLSDVPFLYLALAVVGVPLAAMAAGWLLAGREPRVIARRVIE